MTELLARCGRAGARFCPLAAGGGDPATKYRTVLNRLKQRPVTVPATGDQPAFTLDYAGYVSGTLSALYSPDGLNTIIQMTAALYRATTPALAPAQLAGARRDLAVSAHALRSWVAPGRGFPYDNSLDAFSGVTCTDARHPAPAASWPAMVAKADKRAPDFGPAWAWSTVQCATDIWRAHDSAAYLGPFNRRTSAPVLVVGDYYDPATNYAEAVSTSKLLPNARLLSSDSWGHTAYGTSKCATSSVDSHLVTGALPRAGTVCTGDVQPFTTPPAVPSAAALERVRDVLPAGSTAPAPPADQPAAGAAKKLPPVVLPPQFRTW